MTMKLALAPSLLNPATLTAVQLLTRQSVTPMSRTAFVRQPELLYEAIASHWSYSWLAHLAETRAG